MTTEPLTAEDRALIETATGWDLAKVDQFMVDHDDLRAIIAGVREKAQQSAWRPIEMAPAACHVLATHWSDPDAEWMVDVVMSPPAHPFTHWMPLPSPPATRELGQAEGEGG